MSGRIHRKCCCKNRMCDKFRSELQYKDIPWSNCFWKVSKIERWRYFCLKKVGWSDDEICNLSREKDLRLCLLHFNPHDIIKQGDGGYKLAKNV